MALFTVRYTFNANPATWNDVRQEDRRTVVINAPNMKDASNVGAAYVKQLAKHLGKRNGYIFDVIPIGGFN